MNRGILCSCWSVPFFKGPWRCKPHGASSGIGLPRRILRKPTPRGPDRRMRNSQRHADTWVTWPKAASSWWSMAVSSRSGATPPKRVKLSSVRKSFLSALYGIHVRAGRLDLTKTLAQLGIDDQPPLTATEKTATLRMVLQARSGVPRVRRRLARRSRGHAPRSSQPPGSFWYYNNWDFNVLGTVFEQQLHLKIAAEFRDQIAAPLGCKTSGSRICTTSAAQPRQPPSSNRLILPTTSA